MTDTDQPLPQYCGVCHAYGDHRSTMTSTMTVLWSMNGTPAPNVTAVHV